MWDSVDSYPIAAIRLLLFDKFRAIIDITAADKGILGQEDAPAIQGVGKRSDQKARAFSDAQDATGQGHHRKSHFCRH